MGTWRYSESDLGPYLPAVENSFKRFGSLLADPLCGWHPGDITRIANESDPGRVPDLLMREFGAATDVALFYYVGHGLLSDDEDTELCLGLTGTVSTDPYRRVPTSLMFPAVRRALLKSRATTKIVILDCCNSGAVLRPVLAGSTIVAPDVVPSDFLDGADVEGSYVLVAAARNKSAYYELSSDRGSPQTYFTKYLADLVESGIEGGPPELSLELLFGRLRSNLVAGGHPRPDRRNVQSGGGYPFCRNAAYTTASESLGRPAPDSRPVFPTADVHLAKPTAGPDRLRIPAGGRRSSDRLDARRGRGTILGASVLGVIAVAVGASVLIPRLSGDASRSTRLSYVFSQAWRDHGLVVSRRWSVDQANNALFTETLRVTDPTDSAIRASFAELVPAALRSRIAKADFTPPKPKLTAANAVLQWEIQVPAHGHLSLGYQVRLTSTTLTQTELDQWAAAVAGPVPSPSAVNGELIKSLTIRPARPQLQSGGHLRLILVGVLHNGQRAPEAEFATATWASSDHAVLTVAASGTVTAHKPGSARVTVRFGTVTASVIVKVTGAAAPSPGFTYSYQPTPPQHTTTPTPTSVPTVTPSTI
jgi:hypothetical protein